MLLLPQLQSLSSRAYPLITSLLSSQCNRHYLSSINFHHLPGLLKKPKWSISFDRHQFLLQNAARGQSPKLDFESTNDSSSNVWIKFKLLSSTHTRPAMIQLPHHLFPPHLPPLTCSSWNHSCWLVFPAFMEALPLALETHPPTSAWYLTVNVHQTYLRNLKKKVEKILWIKLFPF